MLAPQVHAPPLSRNLHDPPDDDVADVRGVARPRERGGHAHEAVDAGDLPGHGGEQAPAAAAGGGGGRGRRRSTSSGGDGGASCCRRRRRRRRRDEVDPACSRPVAPQQASFVRVALCPCPGDGVPGRGEARVRQGDDCCCFAFAFAAAAAAVVVHLLFSPTSSFASSRSSGAFFVFAAENERGDCWPGRRGERVAVEGDGHFSLEWWRWWWVAGVEACGGGGLMTFSFFFLAFLFNSSPLRVL